MIFFPIKSKVFTFFVPFQLNLVIKLDMLQMKQVAVFRVLFYTEIFSFKNHNIYSYS